MKTTTPRPPMRAIAPPPPDVAMPTIRLETTSGITVMRIALTNSVPTGSTAAATRRDRSGSNSLSASPTPTPAASAMRTRVVSDTPQSYARSERRKLRDARTTNDKTREAPYAPRAVVRVGTD